MPEQIWRRNMEQQVSGEIDRQLDQHFAEVKAREDAEHEQRRRQQQLAVEAQIQRLEGVK